MNISAAIESLREAHFASAKLGDRLRGDDEDDARGAYDRVTTGVESALSWLDEPYESLHPLPEAIVEWARATGRAIVENG